MRMIAIGIVLAAALAACGSDPADDPVATTPLAGDINGMPWTAGSAIARSSSEAGERSVHMYPDTDVTCERGFGDEPYVAALVPWAEGAVPLGLQSDATVFFYFDATAYLVLEGRVEVLGAPTEVGATVPFRIRAIFEDSDDDLHVEGEVQVQICE
ncbi:MAG TPA: hypothetical protein VM261_14590 [Kofleriaceae bacterium]|nr:hypothetical protein [Kofleriaceae bacterium]